MKNIALLALIVLISYTTPARAEGFVASLKSSRGDVVLRNILGQPISLRDKIIRFEIDTPSFFGSPRRWYNDERVLDVKESGTAFQFRIPAPRVGESGNEFSVHRSYNEQTAHIISKRTAYNHTVRQSEQVITCQYPEMIVMPVTSVDGKGNVTVTTQLQTVYYDGHERASIKEDWWTDRLDIQIFNDKGHRAYETQPKDHYQMTILQHLSSCG